MFVALPQPLSGVSRTPEVAGGSLGDSSTHEGSVSLSHETSRVLTREPMLSVGRGILPWALGCHSWKELPLPANKINSFGVYMESNFSCAELSRGAERPESDNTNDTS